MAAERPGNRGVHPAVIFIAPHFSRRHPALQLRYFFVKFDIINLGGDPQGDAGEPGVRKAAMKRTVAEINERIRKGQAVVLTAEEVGRLVKEKGVRKAAAEVDVVTTGTFGPMCSSGAIINTGHSKPASR